MARAINGGWDFVEEGETYQYKENGLFMRIKVLEDNSNDDYYDFLVEIVESQVEMPFEQFEIKHVKEMDGIFNGMSQIYETEVYRVNYRWKP